MNVRTVAQERKMSKIFDYSYMVVPSDSDFSWAQHTLDFYYSNKYTEKLDYGMKITLRKQYLTLYDSPMSYTIEDPDQLYRVGANGSVSWKMTGQWYLHTEVSTFFASDFKEAMDFSEMQYSGNILLGLGFGPPHQDRKLKLGLGYGILRKRPLLYPIFSYSQSLSKNLTLELGYPHSTLHYKINERHYLNSTGTFKGEYTNIHLPMTTSNDLPFGTVRLLQYAYDLNMGYHYKIQPHWDTVIKIGYLLDNTATITDDHDNILYDLATSPSFYVSMGVTYKILN
jgi:hypothetical protein|tara:strand:- start:308 stop:1159 length:852 start_codon:yes stop_codon:yes gene_type:complete